MNMHIRVEVQSESPTQRTNSYGVDMVSTAIEYRTSIHPPTETTVGHSMHIAWLQSAQNIYNHAHQVTPMLDLAQMLLA